MPDTTSSGHSPGIIYVCRLGPRVTKRRTAVAVLRAGGQRKAVKGQGKAVSDRCCCPSGGRSQRRSGPRSMRRSTPARCRACRSPRRGRWPSTPRSLAPGTAPRTAQARPRSRRCRQRSGAHHRGRRRSGAPRRSGCRRRSRARWPGREPGRGPSVAKCADTGQ